SYWGGSVGGGRRKYFSLSDEGVKIAEQNQSEWEYSRTIIDSLISDKDFDFSNPAPSLVNMRMLKNTTTRVPSREADGEELDYEPVYVLPQQDSEEQEKLKAALEEKERELAEQKSEMEAERARHEEEIRFLQSREEAILAEKQTQYAYYTERERQFEEAINKNEELLKQHADENANVYSEELRERDEALLREREHYEMLLVEKEAQIEEQRAAHQRELVEMEALIRKQAHDEVLHQNYLNLVNTPPPPPARKTEEYSYYTAPVAEEQPEAKEPAPAQDEETEYRTVVRQMYENAIQSEQPEREVKQAQSLDGVSFRDIQERAAEDGIRITTAGKKTAATERSASLVHKGKALFLSALVVFFLCIAEGGIVLGLQEQYGLPHFFPYFMWGIGLAVLLITGLAYANHFGERALRRSSPALINAIVLYALAVIV
ncbi:MAG: hypothetical protein K2N74_03020, partial [Clostridiales bacterium]|nr:hypothetical protein [Clostridiales bacterium]